ncbi:MAG: dethiobiotin synthase, partial [Gammaproteobacteria bacterium]|nr:dethiobiotin synthase [Gammaproteobacteria bacterium]
TDVGKTFVSGCIATHLVQAGITVSPRKPIASGCIRQTDGSLLPEDALFLQQSSQSHDTLGTICPYQFEPAVSPQTAIKDAGLNITLHHLVQACLTPADSFALVEGAGGFYSPLALDGLNKDLATALQLPVIVVVANQLGCINQTLLTLAAIKQAGLVVHSIILNNVNNDPTNHAKGLTDFTDTAIFSSPYSETKQATLIEGWRI